MSLHLFFPLVIPTIYNLDAEIKKRAEVHLYHFRLPTADKTITRYTELMLSVQETILAEFLYLPEGGGMEKYGVLVKHCCSNASCQRTTKSQWHATIRIYFSRCLHVSQHSTISACAPTHLGNLFLLVHAEAKAELAVIPKPHSSHGRDLKPLGGQAKTCNLS